MSRICVLGLGYIGLPTSVMFSTNGFHVIGVDTNRHIVATINKGDIHIQEPGLKSLVQAAIKSGNLEARWEPEPAEAFIIAVPTPLTEERQADLSYVKTASESIVPHLAPGNLVILESTGPPRTTQDVVAPILERSGLKAGDHFFLAYCPERVLPGNVLQEIVGNDRIIGGINHTSAQRAQQLYHAFVTGTFYLTDATTAEVVKLAENTYRDVNIALANELARTCTLLGVDVWKAIDLANRHPRVHFHHPGPGVGGHCLPIDPWFLIAAAPEATPLIRLSRESNDTQPSRVVQEVLDLLGDIANPKVAVLGVAYKADVDDIRESPTLAIVAGLEEAGVRLEIHDPHVGAFPSPLSDLEGALEDADLVLLLTDHKEFQDLDPAILGPRMRNRMALDTRNCWDPVKWRDAGFHLKRWGVGDVQD